MVSSARGIATWPTVSRVSRHLAGTHHLAATKRRRPAHRGEARRDEVIAAVVVSRIRCVFTRCGLERSHRPDETGVLATRGVRRPCRVVPATERPRPARRDVEIVSRSHCVLTHCGPEHGRRLDEIGLLAATGGRWPW